MLSHPRKTLMIVSVATLLGSVQSAMADTTIRVMRVEISQVEKDYYAEIAREFENSHPGVTIELDYLSNEAYKSKLPTLLQSDQRPDIFYSWGGEALKEKVEAGFVKDLTAAMQDGWQARFPDSAIDAFTINGKIYGAPLYVTEVGLWTNTALTEKAGVDIDAIDTWQDFLNAVATLKEAGVTPIVVGAKDGWPMHFYWGSLATRLAGQQGFKAAKAGEGEGFAAPPFVQVGEKLKQLVELEPFQPGFMTTTYERASGMFGDGEAAFHLMGDWDYLPSKQRSMSGEGVPDEDLRFISFPTVEGGQGNEATFGGLNGWAITRDAPDETVAFLKSLLSLDNQREAARRGIFVPIVKGAEKALTTPYGRKVAEDIDQASYHQIFLDHDLGVSVGATVNDISTDIAQGVTSPEEAAERVEEAWQFR
ncbi:ABC transporter substrate-binding protein [Modicisalibacter luteus]|uniref:ABC transporter substrate-binding protein n=1 Tax=Modicisalibacter luteus TaxID=453962 RepID=A0ABV7LZM4_9GAMM|nr:ABC transporter substrate-binding protein [Halomonas lutea]GHB05825.1 ABC transporter substrate-binding protein [Halomonas lutea]